jgi:hypothetical protein
MIHLYVAKQIADMHPQLINSLPQYYLGVLSPDSVHFRSDFKPNDKNTSHLTAGDERWGETTKTDEWLANVLSFLSRYENTDNWDFAFGYAVHILVDLCNNIHVFMGLRLQGKVDMDSYYDGTFHREQAAIDLLLAREFPYKDEIWALLEKAEPLTIPGIVYADDVEKIKENILHIQYADMSSEVTGNEIFTYDDSKALIEKAVAFTAEKLDYWVVR